MAESLSYKIETLLIALLNKDATLAALTGGIRHRDADTANATPVVTVSVTMQELHKEGPKHTSFTAELTIASDNVSASTLEDLISRAVAVMIAPNTSGVDLTAFTYIRIEDEISGTRITDPETRETTITYPIEALAV